MKFKFTAQEVGRILYSHLVTHGHLSEVADDESQNLTSVVEEDLTETFIYELEIERYKK